LPSLGERLKKGWNAFRNNKDPTFEQAQWNVYSSTFRPDRLRLTGGNEKSIITAIYNRIALDVSSISIKHVRVDENGRYKEEMDSHLNNVLTLDANTDQTGRALIQDAVMSMFDEGVVAIVPVDVKGDPLLSDSYDIYTVRTAKILEWYPKHIRVSMYDERTGKRDEIIIPKRIAAIVENPFYSVMNDRNSVLKRLVRKLNLLDAVDEQSASGKMDLIIQLPYSAKTPLKKQQAEDRRHDIESQLIDSKYGIAYIDGTEHVVQLNRAVENNMMSSIEYLTSMLYSQLTLTPEVMNGSAKEEVMLNYNNRTVEPIVAAIVDEMNRKYLTPTARTQGQRIQYFREPFRLVPINGIADIADTFTRNEILSPNEIRGIVGFRPSDDAEADKLRNRNINQAKQEIQNSSRSVVPAEEGSGSRIEEALARLNL
jgi:hypothetical protein